MDRWGKAFWGLAVGSVVFFSYVFIVNYLNPEEEMEIESTCMELMDMDFPSEQECHEFVQKLLNEVEDKSDPLIQKLLKNYNP